MIDLKKIVNEAYELSMPQHEFEITELTNIIFDHVKEDSVIVEIGTKYGGTFYIWNKINPAGKNISIDLNDGGLHGGIIDDIMDRRDLWFQERFDNCYFIRGNSHDYSTKQQLESIIYKDNKEFPINKKVDFLFLDGDHSYEGIKKDFQMYATLVKKGSYIGFHDIIDSERHQERNVFVNKFWNEIISTTDGTDICIFDSQKYKFKEFVVGNSDWGGIGLLQKI